MKVMRAVQKNAEVEVAGDKFLSRLEGEIYSEN